MPLAAMMIWKPVSLAIALLSSTVSVKRSCGEFEQPVDIDRRVETRGVLAKYFGGADRQRGIEKDRRGRHFAALHQIDQIDDQLLGAFDRESGNQQRALAACGVADLGRQACAARVRL